MAHDEPMIVVFGTIGGGTSAVASVLHHLGVFMGAEFGASYRELQQNWEDAGIGQLCRRAVNAKSAQLQMEPHLFQEKLKIWADGHRRAARALDQRPGVKHPLLCAAIDLLDDAWGPIVPVVVDRPFAKVLATLKRLDWWPDERDGVESTTHLLAARDLSLADRSKVHIDFEELRATPVPVIRRLADELGLVVTPDQLEAAANSVVGSASMPRDVDPFQRFIDQLLPAVERNPEDVRALSLLGQVYFDAGDHANARKWYERMLEVGGSSDEESFLAMFRIAESMEKLGDAVASGSGRVSAGVGIPADPRRTAVLHRSTPLQREALPARLPVRGARRRNSAPRRRHALAVSRYLRLASSGRAGEVRVLPRRARCGVHPVAATAGLSRYP